MDEMAAIAKKDLLDEDVVLTAHEEMVANTIGVQVMNDLLEHLKSKKTIRRIIQATETEAIKALEEICQVLDDDQFSDRQCLYQIDAIISILASRGIFVQRHDS